MRTDYMCAPCKSAPPLALRARVVEATAQKSVVEVSLEADGKTTATGRVVAVRIPESMRRR